MPDLYAKKPYSKQNPPKDISEWIDFHENQLAKKPASPKKDPWASPKPKEDSPMDVYTKYREQQRKAEWTGSENWQTAEEWDGGENQEPVDKEADAERQEWAIADKNEADALRKQEIMRTFQPGDYEPMKAEVADLEEELAVMRSKFVINPETSEMMMPTYDAHQEYLAKEERFVTLRDKVAGYEWATE